jgi:hypothetical protein
MRGGLIAESGNCLPLPLEMPTEQLPHAWISDPVR